MQKTQHPKHTTHNRATIMDDRWTLVYTTNRIGQPELIKHQFEAHGIETVVINKQDSNYHFGSAEVYVRNEDADQAYVILKEIDH